MKQPYKTVIKGCLVGAALFIFYMLAHRQSLNVVSQWKQSDSLPYDGRGPYYLAVLEGDMDWRELPFHWRHRYSLYIGRDSESPGYGHMMDFTFYPTQGDNSDVNTAIKNAKTEWTESGVTFVATSGHRLFIPQTMFTGGR